MKAFLVIHFIWACLLAFCWGLDTVAGAFDIALSVICYLWVICAFGMFFRARWAWWGSFAILCAVILFQSAGAAGALFDLAMGRLVAAKHWPGWGIMLGFYLPTLGLLFALLFTKKLYAGPRAITTA